MPATPVNLTRGGLCEPTYQTDASTGTSPTAIGRRFARAIQPRRAALFVLHVQVEVRLSHAQQHFHQNRRERLRFAAAQHRSALVHARIRMSEPRAGTLSGTADEVTAAAGRYLRELEEMAVRLAEATGQPRSRIEDDLSAGRLLSAAEAKEYGLVDEVVGRDAG